MSEAVRHVHERRGGLRLRKGHSASLVEDLQVHAVCVWTTGQAREDPTLRCFSDVLLKVVAQQDHKFGVDGYAPVSPLARCFSGLCSRTVPHSVHRLHNLGWAWVSWISPHSSGLLGKTGEVHTPNAS